MKDFIKHNYLFIITFLAFVTSFVWFIISPDFEPFVTSLLSIVASINLRPKDWMLIKYRSINELPEVNYREKAVSKSGFLSSNVVDDKSGGNKFDWDSSSLDDKDRSLLFNIEKPEYLYPEWDEVPVRVVMSSLSNTYGENQHFLYTYIPDKPPVCFYQFDAICAEMTIIDIDDKGTWALIIGFKCGAHSEGIKVFKMDKNLNFYQVENSEIGSDFPLITWGKTLNKEFYINSYSRNWDIDRETWNSRHEVFIYRNSKFELDTTTKVKWIEKK